MYDNDVEEAIRQETEESGQSLGDSAAVQAAIRRAAERSRVERLALYAQELLLRHVTACGLVLPQYEGDVESTEANHLAATAAWETARMMQAMAYDEWEESLAEMEDQGDIGVVD